MAGVPVVVPADDRDNCPAPRFEPENPEPPLVVVTGATVRAAAGATAEAGTVSRSAAGVEVGIRSGVNMKPPRAVEGTRRLSSGAGGSGR
jgi:hypothetical protein